MHRGQRVAGRFEIEEQAGEGGMGTVFRAVDRKTRRPVAVKVLRDRELVSAARFAREAELLAGLSHPGIVQYIAHGVSPDGLHYLVMDWVEGETLARRLAHGGVSPRAAVRLAAQVADALAAAHARGVIHRDVKPSNLMFPVDERRAAPSEATGGRRGGESPPMIDKVDRVVVVDFGIARYTADEQKLTMSGAMIGTLGYMAPEQARGSRTELGPPVDVFALGCVLYECLTGRPPFAGDAMVAVRAKLLLCDPPRLAQLRPDLPGAVDE